MAAWSVYLLRTADGALYTGIALDVEQRLLAHRDGAGAKALRGRGPLQLVYACRLGDRGLAQRVEARVKRLGKPAKEALVGAAPTRSRLLRLVGLSTERAPVKRAEPPAGTSRPTGTSRAVRRRVPARATARRR